MNQKKEQLINNKSFEGPAGVSSGFIERFELEKYNPKILPESKSYFKIQRPYTTQTEMNVVRRQRDKQAIKAYMDDWDKLNPYYVDRPIPQQSPETDKKYQTNKEKAQDKNKYFRALNGLEVEATEIEPSKNNIQAFRIPTTCKETFNFIQNNFIYSRETFNDVL